MREMQTFVLRTFNTPPKIVGENFSPLVVHLTEENAEEIYEMLEKLEGKNLVQIIITDEENTELMISLLVFGLEKLDPKMPMIVSVPSREKYSTAPSFVRRFRPLEEFHFIICPNKIQCKAKERGG